ncbi:hypothetical protein [Terribacillus saccharophilus]|uniref:hypothetical protein n=1 Tax=Terribacillus saccharophilus TaxID=361277 RepID=UPI000C9CEF68|nr:hypothetical protein [Terribacillus goriensis]
MSRFTGYGRTNDIDFGDYVEIEQHRYYAPNEMFIHKVIGALKSNTWMDTPIRHDSKEVLHDTSEIVLNVICCGIDETKVFRVRQADCTKLKGANK